MSDDDVQTRPNDVANPEAPISSLRRLVYLLLAAVFFVLGALGIVLPGLPTTPFLLLTSYFLVRSSPKLNARLLESKWFGPVLRDWQQKGGIRSAVRFRALAVIAVVVPLTIWLAPVPLWGRVAIGMVALIGVIVVLRIPVLPDAEDP